MGWREHAWHYRVLEDAAMPPSAGNQTSEKQVAAVRLAESKPKRPVEMFRLNQVSRYFCHLISASETNENQPPKRMLWSASDKAK
jgi:hypothetical protein